MGRHAQVLHEIVDAADMDGQGDAERHGDDDQQRIDGSRNAYLYIAVEHVADEVDQRDSRHDEKGAGHQRMPRRVGVEQRMKRGGQIERRDKGGSPCQQSGNECGDGDVHIMIGTQFVEYGPQAESENGCNGSIEECRPVATELDAESAAGKPGTDRYLPRGVIAFPAPDVFQLFLVSFQRIVFPDRPP